VYKVEFLGGFFGYAKKILAKTAFLATPKIFFPQEKKGLSFFFEINFSFATGQKHL